MPSMYTDTQRREIFHLCFLERLLKQADRVQYGTADMWQAMQDTLLELLDDT